jgi:hypothetical protein
MLDKPTELILGRGKVFFDRTMGDLTIADGEQYFGNTKSFQINRSVERLGTRTSYGGLLHEGKGHVISEDVTVSITTDNISWDNYTSWFSVDSAPDVEIPGSDTDSYVEELKIKQDRYFQLGTSFQTFGGFFFDSLVINIKNQSALLREGLEYTFDRKTGRLYIMPDGPRAPNGRSIVCTYTKRDSATKSVNTSAREMTGAMRYIAQNAYGTQTHLWFPKVRISPVGNIEMKSDEFQELRFEAIAMKKSPITPLLVAYREGVAPISITADTDLSTADNSEMTVDSGSFE